MSQHDLTIANQGFPAFRADLNNALQALGSTQSGTSAPSPTFANQLWYDTTNNILKIRNADNDAWISLLTLNQTSDTLSTLSTSADASISGLTVGKGAGSVSSNTALGNVALPANTSGQYNTSVGHSNLRLNTSGSHNSAFGYGALDGTTTGANNTAVGSLALVSNTTASNNTAVGYQASYSGTTADNNASFGYQALYTNTTGNANAAFGSGALKLTTSGENAAFGSAALTNNTTGSNNVAVGRQALVFNTTADNNTAVGYQAGYANTTGTRNVIVGKGALSQNTTGSYNVALGYETLSANTTPNYNTAVGYQAGYSNTTGAQNTFVGLQAGYAITTGSKNTVIGAYNGNQGGLDIRTASNYIVLSDGDGNPRAYWTSAGTLLNQGQGRFTTTVGGTECIQLNNDATSGTRYLAYFRVNAVEVGSITTGGTTTAYNTSSDYRLKENVAPMTGALDKVALLKPCTYTWKKDNSNGQGFIAHELAEIFPDAVAGEKDGVREDGTPIYQGVDASFLVATLTAAIQELKAEVDSLKAQLN